MDLMDAAEVFLLFMVLALLTLPYLAAHWVACRIKARRCPNCGKRWMTELVGEWGGEDWHCTRCDHYWTVEVFVHPITGMREVRDSSEPQPKVIPWEERERQLKEAKEAFYLNGKEWRPKDSAKKDPSSDAS